MTKIKKIIQQKWSVQYNSYFIVLLILSFTSVISFQQIFIPTFIKLYIRNYQKNVFFNITSINMVFVDSICCILTAILVIYFFETRLNILLNSPSIFPNIYQYIIENINNFILNLLNSIMERKKESQILFPSIYALFIVLLITNVQGMVPYSFTLASHLIDTFFLALTFFSFIIVTILIRNNTKYFLTIFMPAGSPFNLAF
jgi:F-type H+-transporting ATPase subunit a